MLILTTVKLTMDLYLCACVMRDWYQKIKSPLRSTIVVVLSKAGKPLVMDIYVNCNKLCKCSSRKQFQHQVLRLRKTSATTTIATHTTVGAITGLTISAKTTTTQSDPITCTSLYFDYSSNNKFNKLHELSLRGKIFLFIILLWRL